MFHLSVRRFDEFASEYAEKFRNIDAYKAHFDEFCDHIGEAAPVILELACGPGNVTRYVRQRFPESEYLAIDLAPAMIEIAKREVPGVDFRILDVRNIAMLGRRFDAILCSFCLPFLSKADARQLIADCAGLLDRNGVLYLSTMEGDETDAGFEPTSFSGNAEVYFNYHRQDDLDAALEANGFRCVHFARQDYQEADGSGLVDLIWVCVK